MALRLAPRAMDADRGKVRKQAPPDVTLRSGGEGNGTTASIAAPNVMGSNAPLATDAWMRRRRKLLTLRKLFLKRKLLAVRRQEKIRKKIKTIMKLLTLRKLFLKRKLLALRRQKKNNKENAENPDVNGKVQNRDSVGDPGTMHQLPFCH